MLERFFRAPLLDVDWGNAYFLLALTLVLFGCSAIAVYVAVIGRSLRRIERCAIFTLGVVNAGVGVLLLILHPVLTWIAMQVGRAGVIAAWGLAVVGIGALWAYASRSLRHFRVAH